MLIRSKSKHVFSQFYCWMLIILVLGSVLCTPFGCIPFQIDFRSHWTWTHSMIVTILCSNNKKIDFLHYFYYRWSLKKNYCFYLVQKVKKFQTKDSLNQNRVYSALFILCHCGRTPPSIRHWRIQHRYISHRDCARKKFANWIIQNEKMAKKVFSLFLPDVFYSNVFSFFLFRSESMWRKKRKEWIKSRLCKKTWHIVL